jgi:hypothetical protein
MTKKIYVISTIHIYKTPPPGAPNMEWNSTWRGWFSTLALAKKQLLRNASWYQDNYGSYAVIESVTEGTSEVKELQWYKFGLRGKLWIPEKVTIRECKRPKRFKHTIQFCGVGL